MFAVFAMLGMLSPASRGALMTAGIFLFMFMGYVTSGFVPANLQPKIMNTVDVHCSVQ